MAAMPQAPPAAPMPMPTLAPVVRVDALVVGVGDCVGVKMAAGVVVELDALLVLLREDVCDEGLDPALVEEGVNDTAAAIVAVAGSTSALTSTGVVG